MILKRKPPENIHSSDIIYFEKELEREIIPSSIVKKENITITAKDSKIYFRSSSNIFFSGNAKVPVLVNTSKWLNGYFHWLTEVLPLFERVMNDTEISEKDIIHYALPQYFLNFEFIKQSFELFPYIQPIALEKWSRKRYRRAYIFEKNTPSGNYVPAEVASLREYLREAVNASQKKPLRRIFVSRKKSKRRKLINENEIYSILNQHNFEIVYPEDYSWLEQVQIFATATHLIGIHGAALTNMLFMDNGSSVLEIRAANDKTNNCFYSLADALGLRYYYFIASIHEVREDRLGDFEIDINRFEKTLQAFLE